MFTSDNRNVWCPDDMAWESVFTDLDFPDTYLKDKSCLSVCISIHQVDTLNSDIRHIVRPFIRSICPYIEMVLLRAIQNQGNVAVSSSSNVSVPMFLYSSKQLWFSIMCLFQFPDLHLTLSLQFSVLSLCSHLSPRSLIWLPDPLPSCSMMLMLDGNLDCLKTRGCIAYSEREQCEHISMSLKQPMLNC